MNKWRDRFHLDRWPGAVRWEIQLHLSGGVGQIIRKDPVTEKLLKLVAPGGLLLSSKRSFSSFRVRLYFSIQKWLHQVYSNFSNTIFDSERQWSLIALSFCWNLAAAITWKIAARHAIIAAVSDPRPSAFQKASEGKRISKANLDIWCNFEAEMTEFPKLI